MGRSNTAAHHQKEWFKGLSWGSLSALSILRTNTINFAQNLHQDGSIFHRLVISPQSSRFLKWSWASHRHGYSKQTPSERQTRNFPSKVFWMTVSSQDNLISSIIWQKAFDYFGGINRRLCIKWHLIPLMWKWNYWLIFINGNSISLGSRQRLSSLLRLSDKVSSYHIKAPSCNRAWSSLLEPKEGLLLLSQLDWTE